MVPPSETIRNRIANIHILIGSASIKIYSKVFLDIVAQHVIHGLYHKR